VAVSITETLLEPKLFTYSLVPTTEEEYGLVPTEIVLRTVSVAVSITETLFELPLFTYSLVPTTEEESGDEPTEIPELALAESTNNPKAEKTKIKIKIIFL
jgi:hypothetical protein